MQLERLLARQMEILQDAAVQERLQALDWRIPPAALKYLNDAQNTNGAATDASRDNQGMFLNNNTIMISSFWEGHYSFKKWSHRNKSAWIRLPWPHTNHTEWELLRVQQKNSNFDHQLIVHIICQANSLCSSCTNVRMCCFSQFYISINLKVRLVGFSGI